MFKQDLNTTTMLTMNWILENKFPIDYILNDRDKQELIDENKDNNYSYLCLLKEMLSYRHMSVESLLNGWGGVKLFSLK